MSKLPAQEEPLGAGGPGPCLGSFWYWRFHSLSVQPVTVLRHFAHSNVFVDCVVREPPVLWFVPNASCPGEEPGSFLSALFFQVFIDIDESSPEPSLPQAELILRHLFGPWLDPPVASCLLWLGAQIWTEHSRC